MKRMRLIALAVACLLLAGCGNTATGDTQTSSTHEFGATIATAAPRPEVAMKDCYMVNQQDTGTYSYLITDCYGDTILSGEKLAYPVTVQPLTDEVLIVSGQSAAGVENRWARVCNIRSGYAYGTIAFYLAVKGDRVAFVENRTDAYHVFVSDLYDPTIYHSVTTLEGYLVEEGVPMTLDFDLGEDGILSVVYPTKKGDKTVKIDMNAQ